MNPAVTLVLALASIVLIVLLTSRLKLHAFFSLILVALALALATLPADTVVTVLKGGFGGTLGAIGLIIMFGTAIGVILDRTGAAWSMADAVLRLTGRDQAPRAIGITGFIAGMPIFCDSGFIVLSGLNKSLAATSGKGMVRMAATLGVALYTLHCLIPPHPGITAAAGILGGSIGKLVLLGTIIALPTALAGYLWVKLMAPRSETGAAAAAHETRELPGAFISFLPVVVPLALISANSATNLLGTDANGILVRALRFIGDPAIALLLGVVCAFPLLRGRGFRQTNEMLAEAVEKAGPILIITAAGGAFGAVIKATGFGDHVSALLNISSLGLLVPFALAAMLKTAQGSSTVAALTTASIVAPMLPGLGLDSESGRTLALLATGSGSMMISHANDSYFWVISRFSEISPQATLRVYSTATIVVSTCSFALTWGLSFFLR